MSRKKFCEGVRRGGAEAIKIDESKCFCRKCGTHVYPVERIIAEKNFYHKNCFRCKECNKLLSVDGYMSHEAEIYCKIHFKQLFQPKARFDNDAGPRRQRRHEMIIRENIPEELPPDVVRSSTNLVKVNLLGSGKEGLSEAAMYVRNKRGGVLACSLHGPCIRATCLSEVEQQRYGNTSVVE
ncbi:hypothetical protein HPB50_023650 [Hyalomma asiaticum]|uniref:Uncharacterized protein n=1 Tax=Hyalomma asiaticum TaxID=266040 RepID=A0ACB7TAF4_HYAAI|nr:hypothetical protein HPB50_023650 [Hyalomma asiaticum]